MIIQEVRLDSIVVKQPKRYDTYMCGKIAHADDKLIIDLPGVKLISSKDVSNIMYIKMKLAKDQERFMLDMEERLMSVTIENIETWFKSKMNRDTVDEYFQSGLVYDRKLRCILKLRIDNPSIIPDLELASKFVDIKLRVVSLKFLKTSFWVCYDIVECVPSRAVLFQGDEDDDTTSLAGGLIGDLDEAGPDVEEVERVRAYYLARLDDKIKEHEMRLDILRKLHNELNKDCFSLATFDAVENVIAWNKFVDIK